MRSGGATKIVAAQIVSEKKERKSLHPLQLAATDKENLVGAGRHLRSLNTDKRAVKNEMSDKMKGELKKTIDKSVVLKSSSCKKVIDKIKTESKKVQKDRKIFKDKSIHTETVEKIKISSEDLISQVDPSENYWKILAERRRIALQDTLEENQILSDQIRVYKEMLDESRALVDVLKEMLGDDTNDINNSLEDSRH